MSWYVYTTPGMFRLDGKFLGNEAEERSLCALSTMSSKLGQVVCTLLPLPLLSLEVVTPAKQINSLDAVMPMQQNPPHKRF